MAQAAIRSHLPKDNSNNLLDFSNFDAFVNCIKWKQTNIRRLDTNRISNIFELINTNICRHSLCPFGMVNSILSCSQTIFHVMTTCISFQKKFQSPDMFKVCKANVENHLNKRTKYIRSVRVSKYYSIQMDQVNNIQGFLLNTTKNIELFHNI